jgi:hypothetical protein
MTKQKSETHPSLSVFVPANNPSQTRPPLLWGTFLYTQRERKALNEQIISEHRAKSCARDFRCLEPVMDIHVICCTYIHTANRTCLMHRNFIARFRLGTNEDNPKDVVKGAAREIIMNYKPTEWVSLSTYSRKTSTTKVENHRKYITTEMRYLRGVKG